MLAQPEQPPLFDGVIGVAFLIGLPVLIWALWKFELPAEVKVGAGVCGIMFLFWLFSSQQVRYLLPVLPVLAVGICAAAQTISREKKALGRRLAVFAHRVGAGSARYRRSVVFAKSPA